jgi:putative FmdB family regulatory protein
MPIYNYKCSCGNTFDALYKIADRNLPKEQECKECGITGEIEIQISNVRIVAGVGDFRKKVPDFFKDRLREIKKVSGRGNTIDV